MPYNDPDPTDPNVLVGVVLPADAEAMREMAIDVEEGAALAHGRDAGDRAHHRGPVLHGLRVDGDDLIAGQESVK